MGLHPVTQSGPVLHLLQDNGPVTDDAVGVGFDPKVSGADGEKLRRSDWGGWSCGMGKQRGLVKCRILCLFLSFLV